MAKIVQFHEKGGPEVLKLEDVTLSPVAENDVRFRVHAIGLNRAESMYRKGAYLQDYTWPSRVGYEASGMVEAIGKMSRALRPAMRLALFREASAWRRMERTAKLLMCRRIALRGILTGFCTQMQRQHGFNT